MGVLRRKQCGVAVKTEMNITSDSGRRMRIVVIGIDIGLHKPKNEGKKSDNVSQRETY